MVQHNPPQKIGILQKVTNFLIGFFGGIIIFMFCLGILPSMLGAFLGVGVNVALTYYLLKLIHTKSTRIIVYGLMTSIIAVIAIYLLLTALVFSMFSEIAG